MPEFDCLRHPKLVCLAQLQFDQTDPEPRRQLIGQFGHRWRGTSIG